MSNADEQIISQLKAEYSPLFAKANPYETGLLIEKLYTMGMKAGMLDTLYLAVDAGLMPADTPARLMAMYDKHE